MRPLRDRGPLLPVQGPSARRRVRTPGVHLLVGVVPGTDARLPEASATASRVQGWWRELGFSAELLPEVVTLTPSCGLAGATPGYARTAMTHLREAAKYLQPE